MNNKRTEHEASAQEEHLDGINTFDEAYRPVSRPG